MASARLRIGSTKVVNGPLKQNRTHSLSESDIRWVLDHRRRRCRVAWMWLSGIPGLAAVGERLYRGPRTRGICDARGPLPDAWWYGKRER